MTARDPGYYNTAYQRVDFYFTTSVSSYGGNCS